MRKGQTVTLVLRGADVETSEPATILMIRKGQVWLDNGPGNDPTGPFDQDGRYLDFQTPGFSMRIVE